MNNYIKALNTLDVYQYHSQLAPVIKQIAAGDLIEYNREKRREDTNWMEIYLENGDYGYIRKDKQEMYICKHVDLSDEEATGFDYVIKDKNLAFSDVFKPVSLLKQEEVAEGKERIIVSRLIDKEKNKKEYLLLDYDPELADVTTFTLDKNENFFITEEGGKLKGSFLEINNMIDKKGFILHNTSYTLLKDKWMLPLIILVMIGTVIAIVAAFYESGWLVMGTILIIPAMIVGFIFILLLKVVVSILEGIFHQIRIRL